MRSQQLDLLQYDTDKILNGYLFWYDELLAARWKSVTAVLELGVHHGASLELWRDYFPGATIVGVDNDLSRVRIKDLTRIELAIGQQDDAHFLHDLAERVAPAGFDLIIDDASHIGLRSEASFRALYDHLKAGGIYVIEDWGTGYLEEWPDGRKPRTAGRRIIDRMAARIGFKMRVRSHDYGMAGFIKRLIDDQAISRFQKMTITTGLVAIHKPNVL